MRQFKNLILLGNISFCCILANGNDAAIFCFIFKLDVMTAREYFEQGKEYRETKNYVNALRCYDKAIELDRDYADPWSSKGVVYFDLHNYQKALYYFEIAIELADDIANFWFNKGNALAKLEKYDKAVESYDKAIELDEDFADPWHGKGILYTDLKGYEFAVKCYDKAIELDGDLAKLWHGKGILYANLKDYESAVKCYDKAIELDDKIADIWNRKGNSNSKLNRHQKALNCYDKALELDKNYAHAWNGKGSVYSKHPDLLESHRQYTAQRYYKRALFLDWHPTFFSNYLKTWKYSPKHPLFLYDIIREIPKNGSLYLKNQIVTMCQYTNLWQEYLKKTEKYNQLSQAEKLQFQALINYLMGHPSKAFNILKDEVIPQDSDNLQAYYYLIMSCYEFLENEKSYLETALEIAKKYQKAPFNFNQNEIIQRYYAAHLFWINKDINAAIECLQPVWKSANFLPAAYFYLELNYRKKQYATFDSDEEISDEIYWTDEDIGILKEKHIEEIGDFIMEAEGDGNTKYTFSYGFPIHKIKPDAEEWWQPVYHYAHYREITNAIDLLQFQAKHVFETDVKGSQDLKDFWDCFKIDEKDIITMSEEIRKVGLQKVGQAFLNRTEVHVKDMVGKVDKSEAELKDAIYQVVYGRGDTKEQTKQTFEHLETTLEKASDVQDALVNRIASKIEAKELDGDTETYLYLISYFLLLQELSPKESIYLQFYALYADAFRSGGISKVVQGGVKDVVKTLTGEGFDMAVDVLTAINPVTGLAKATLKPFVKGSMGEFFIAFLKGVQQKTMMQYSISQGIKDGYSIPSFKESFLEFVGKEKHRLGEQFEQTYPLYGYEDWLE